MTRCRRCDAVWAGKVATHCPKCHRTWPDLAGFDQHRGTCVGQTQLDLTTATTGAGR